MKMESFIFVVKVVHAMKKNVLLWPLILSIAGLNIIETRLSCALC